MADAASIFKAKFSDYISTLKETSFDDKNNHYLCQDTARAVYNFDLIIKKLYPNKQPASPDALLIHGKDIYLIEFKNQDCSNIDRESIREKIRKGKEAMDSIFLDSNINRASYNFIFCVAYKISQAKYRRFGKKPLQFELKNLVGSYFNEIYTNDVSFFATEYKKKFKNSLNCD